MRISQFVCLLIVFMSCNPKSAGPGQNDKDIFEYSKDCRQVKEFVPNQLLVYGAKPVKESNMDTILSCPCGDSIYLVVYGDYVTNFEAEEEKIRPPANKEGGITKNFIFDFPKMKDTTKIAGYLKNEVAAKNETSQNKVSVLDTGIHPSRNLNSKVSSSGCPYFDRPDMHGHGSFVSFLILQTILDERGRSGSSASVDFNLFSYNVTNDNGEIDLFNVMCAMEHAAEKGSKVINLSFGADMEIPVFRTFMERLLSRYPQLKIITSAGNNNYNLDVKVHVPSTYYRSFPGRVFQIAALNLPDSVSTWTMWPGSNHLTKGNLAAQGVHCFNGDFAAGTSFAAPIVSGLVTNGFNVIQPVPTDVAYFKNQYPFRMNWR